MQNVQDILSLLKTTAKTAEELELIRNAFTLGRELRSSFGAQDLIDDIVGHQTGSVPMSRIECIERIVEYSEQRFSWCIDQYFELNSAFDINEGEHFSVDFEDRLTDHSGVTPAQLYIGDERGQLLWECCYSGDLGAILDRHKISFGFIALSENEYFGHEVRDSSQFADFECHDVYGVDIHILYEFLAEMEKTQDCFRQS
ncbi:hypothetical protein [Aestuariivirga sp.]|uniref:hypothetical protein n=1 Tax=Aestuariivirga sp. TaxID=2650926 RepID=UPI003784AB6C